MRYDIARFAALSVILPFGVYLANTPTPRGERSGAIVARYMALCSLVSAHGAAKALDDLDRIMRAIGLDNPRSTLH
jgi:hypothetical protein